MSKSLKDKIKMIFENLDMSNAADQRFSKDIRKVKWINGRLKEEPGETREDTFISGSMTFRGQLYIPPKMIDEYYTTSPEQFVKEWFTGDAGLLNTPEQFEDAVHQFPVKNEEIIVNDVIVKPLGNDMYDVQFTLSIGKFDLI
jgi:hypothetical protein